MIWLIGCKGMLGTEVARLLDSKKINYYGTGREIDITNLSAVSNYAQGKQIDWIINCAAYTAVDNAEKDILAAQELNANAPKILAEVAKKIKAKLIHISTDYVFDGSADEPIREDKSVCPCGVYGKTKAMGEKNIAETVDEYYILRTAWLYGWNGKNFVYTIIKAMNNNPSIKVVDDQFGTPTSACDLANVILEIVIKNNDKKIPCGIYHCTDLGKASWYEFALEIKKQAESIGILKNKDCLVNPCSTKDYPTPAKRPSYSVLDKTKIQSALDIKLPDWKESLFQFLRSPLFDFNRLY